MSNGKKIAAILAVFHAGEIEIECHAEHEILLFCHPNENISIKEELTKAGAFYSTEYGMWACWCSA